MQLFNKNSLQYWKFYSNIVRLEVRGMLKSYYFIHTKNDQEQYVVHTEDCAFLGDAASRTLIGLHMNSESAMDEAKKMTSETDFNGCFYCAYSSHTK